MNDWLLYGFKDRISQKRKVELTDRLADGFKRASIRVTKKEEEDEKRLIEERPSKFHISLSIPEADRESASHVLALLRNSLQEIWKEGKQPSSEQTDS